MAVKSSASTLNGQFRNKIINGNFDFWQRNTTGSSNGYIADRWMNYVAGSTFTTSRQAFTVGQTDVPGNPAYFHRTVVTSANSTSNYFLLSQFIENVSTLSGTQASVSLYMRADASKTVVVTFKQNFGSGGSAAVFTSNTFLSLTSAWQRFTIPITFPSITSKTVGANNNLEMQIYYDAGTNYPTLMGNQSGTFDLSEVQVEEGVQTTAFEFRPLGTELALCQRYYEKNYDLDTVPGTALERNNDIAIAVSTMILVITGFSFKVTKRTEPDISIWSRSGVADRVSSLSSNNTVGTSFSYTGASTTRGHYIITDTVANFTAGQAYRLNWAANSEY